MGEAPREAASLSSNGRLPVPFDGPPCQVIFIFGDRHQRSHDVGQPGSLSLIKRIRNGRSDFVPRGVQSRLRPGEVNRIT